MFRYIAVNHFNVWFQPSFSQSMSYNSLAELVLHIVSFWTIQGRGFMDINYKCLIFVCFKHEFIKSFDTVFKSFFHVVIWLPFKLFNFVGIFIICCYSHCYLLLKFFVWSLVKVIQFLQLFFHFFVHCFSWYQFCCIFICSTF